MRSLCGRRVGYGFARFGCNDMRGYPVSASATSMNHLNQTQLLKDFERDGVVVVRHFLERGRSRRDACRDRPLYPRRSRHQAA